MATDNGFPIKLPVIAQWKEPDSEETKLLGRLSRDDANQYFTAHFSLGDPGESIASIRLCLSPLLTNDAGNCTIDPDKQIALIFTANHIADAMDIVAKPVALSDLPSYVKLEVTELLRQHKQPTKPLPRLCSMKLTLTHAPSVAMPRQVGCLANACEQSYVTFLRSLSSAQSFRLYFIPSTAILLDGLGLFRNSLRQRGGGFISDTLTHETFASGSAAPWDKLVVKEAIGVNPEVRIQTPSNKRKRGHDKAGSQVDMSRTVSSSSEKEAKRARAHSGTSTCSSPAGNLSSATANAQDVAAVPDVATPTTTPREEGAHEESSDHLRETWKSMCAYVFTDTNAKMDDLDIHRLLKEAFMTAGSGHKVEFGNCVAKLMMHIYTNYPE